MQLTSCKDSSDGTDIEENPPVAVALNLKFDRQLFDYKEIDFTQYYAESNRGESLQNQQEYIVRYQVRIYSEESIVSDWRGRTPISSFEYFGNNLEELDYTALFKLAPGKYNVLVWTDFVPSSKPVDYFYDTSYFTSINSIKPNEGSNEAKDAFRGQCELSVERDEDDGVTATIEMERALGKFQIIATDFDLFLKDLEKKAETEESQYVNPQDYKVKIRYSGFVPSAFDNFFDRPSNADVGRWFLSPIIPLNEKEAAIGFDYVLAYGNNNEGSVTIYIDLLDDNGKSVGSSTPIKVPILRNHLTVIKGGYLASFSKGGLTINSEYDKDFVIQIK